ncbi:MsnO8 family LLM class oxidoreductase [Paenibacillus sp. JCM 10914]|uniref:LLM class flavin-dependent oxidoreductase n=1 Tax=Paenibacillus sp. JCM 10914 TaxID=1236974 RepID=UPI0003CC53B7|nr:LLM class flavin-dependent oxidoreductase [Paenibacillus sp. JCM 10914]GAE09452.1 bacterial luciferase family protein YtmO, in cluster with L-cystine ABC transporter [Paenibacillus sp. JCM 10914]
MGITISVLDQSPIYPGETAAEALAHTVLLAQKSEELGFRRFWVSEHHDSDHVAGSSPEVLISHLLAKTNSIRVGSGGVMLQHYSPYKVAENFNVLAALAPGRVDLGIGRAPGGLPRSTQALQRGVQEQASLTDKIVELRQHVLNTLEEDHPLAGLRAAPLPEIAPELYVLGASAGSAEIAAGLGLPYVFSLFINGDESAALEAIRIYRSTFDYAHGKDPQILVALSVIVADTEEEAAELAGSLKLVKIHLASGRTLTLGTREQAEEFGRQAGEPYTIEEQEPFITKGTKEAVREQLLRLHQALGIDEIIVTTNVQPFAKRIRSFELLSETLAEVPAEA